MAPKKSGNMRPMKRKMERMMDKEETAPTEENVLSPEFQLWRQSRMKLVTDSFFNLLGEITNDQEKYMYRMNEHRNPPVEAWINGMRVLLGIRLFIGTFPYSNIGDKDFLSNFGPEILRYLNGQDGPVPDTTDEAAEFCENDYYVSHVVDAYYYGNEEWYVFEFYGKEIRFADFDSFECKKYPAEVRDLMDEVFERALYGNRLTTGADKTRYRMYKAKRLEENKIAAILAQQAQNVGSGVNTVNSALQQPLICNPGPSKGRKLSQNPRNRKVALKTSKMSRENLPKGNGVSNLGKMSRENLFKGNGVPNSMKIPHHSGNFNTSQADVALQQTGKAFKVASTSLRPMDGIKLKLKVDLPPKVQSGKTCDPTPIARAIAGQHMPVEHPPFVFPNGPVNIYVPDIKIPRNRDAKRVAEKYFDLSISKETKSYHEMDWEHSSSPNEQQIETAISSISDPNNLVPANYFGSFGGQGNAGGMSPNLNTVVQFTEEQEMAVSQIPWD